MLSTPSKYAIRSLLCLSKEKGKEFVAVDELASKADVPSPYLSKIIKTLIKKKLLKAKRGANGGVQLAKKKITFYAICEALEDSIVVESCFLSNKKCSANSPCPFHHSWGKRRQEFHSYLKSMTVDRQD